MFGLIRYGVSPWCMVNPLVDEAIDQDLLRPPRVRVPKTCATWAKALQSAVERSACAGPVLARPEVG